MVVLVCLHSLTGRKSAAESKKSMTITEQQFPLADSTATLAPYFTKDFTMTEIIALLRYAV